MLVPINFLSGFGPLGFGIKQELESGKSTIRITGRIVVLGKTEVKRKQKVLMPNCVVLGRSVSES